MSESKKHIMVVDDQPANLLLILRVLEEQYRVSCMESGKACIDALAEDKPDLILMDVRMPEMDGYTCCRLIKESFDFQQIPVIFLSAHTQIEDKLKGYEAGGADYLTKPCDIEEVVAKIEHNLKQVIEFQGKLKDANDFASMAMTNSGELGSVLQFMEGTFQCEDQHNLADLILNTLKSYGFNACVQLRSAQETLNKSMPGGCAPLEISLMTEIIGGEKITEFGRRFLCVSKNISVLIKNLPLDDELLCGRLKDHVVSILNGATARMASLNIAYEKEQQVVNRIKQALESIEKTLVNIETISAKKNKDVAKIISGIGEDIHQSFSSLALSEEQENHFMELLNTRSDQLFAATAVDGDLQNQFEAISQKLFDIVSANI